MQVILTTTTNPIAEARSIAGKLVPFRAPHYTCSAVALVDESRLAKGGVLYLDNAGEFKREAVRALADHIKTTADDKLPLAVVVDALCPFRSDGPEPNVEASVRYRERVNGIVAELRIAAACEKSLFRVEVLTKPEPERAIPEPKPEPMTTSTAVAFFENDEGDTRKRKIKIRHPRAWEAWRIEDELMDHADYTVAEQISTAAGVEFVFVGDLEDVEFGEGPAADEEAEDEAEWLQGEDEERYREEMQAEYDREHGAPIEWPLP